MEGKEKANPGAQWRVCSQALGLEDPAVLQGMKGSLSVSSLIPFHDPPRGWRRHGWKQWARGQVPLWTGWLQRPNGLPCGLAPKIAQVLFEALEELLPFGLQKLPLRRTRRGHGGSTEPN